MDNNKFDQDTSITDNGLAMLWITYCITLLLMAEICHRVTENLDNEVTSLKNGKRKRKRFQILQIMSEMGRIGINT